MPKIRQFKGYWTIDDVNKRQHCLFIFGDNDAQFGKGGQAIIRDLQNAVGIPTKKYPTNHPTSFYSDMDLEENKKKISRAINHIIKISDQYEYIIFPEDGLGTGLADLPNKAPKTFEFLQFEIQRLVTFFSKN